MTNDTAGSEWRLLACASQGTGSDDEARLRDLVSNFESFFIQFDRRRKVQSFFECLRQLRSGEYNLFVVEGTGLAVGLAAILGRLLWGQRYVLSSGDAVGPFLTAMLPVGRPLFWAYEKALYHCSAGFVGWTPYLAGRALTMGASRAVTVPGWALFSFDDTQSAIDGAAVRAGLGIPQDALVFGIVGSLVWSKRLGYCYGSELVRAATRCDATCYVLVVGDGSGLEYLKTLAGDRLGRTIFLPGRVARSEVPRYLAAMDMASLPQSVDGVGSFRYTTKLPEYRMMRLPVVTNQIPMAYDLDRGDILRLKGENPWSEQFIAALAGLMETISLKDVDLMRGNFVDSDDFDRERQILRVTAFLVDILEAVGTR